MKFLDPLDGYCGRSELLPLCLGRAHAPLKSHPRSRKGIPKASHGHAAPAPSPAPAGAPRKQEPDDQVIGLIIALMAIRVTGFFAPDNKIDAMETWLNTGIDALNNRIDGLYELMLLSFKA